MWDVLQACWRLRCPDRDTQVAIGLADFRRLQRLAGAQTPPVYRVDFQCSCGSQHAALMTETELDWDPVRLPLPPAYDFVRGAQAWAADELEQRWTIALRRGRWPLLLPCPHEPNVPFGWPSLLRAIEPNADDAAWVSYTCSICGGANARVFPLRALQFAAPPLAP
jgi:hypothetical protein